MEPLKLTREFAPFPKIPRLFRDVVITEKIDGTNASVLVTEDGDVQAASRTRWISPDSDNFGFAAWVREHEEDLRVGLGPGHHFGEWWGRGIQRGYGLDHKRFSLFNVKKWGEARPACCHVVPVIWVGTFSTVAAGSALADLQHGGSRAAPGFMKPEGIVVFHTAGSVLFKATIERDEEPKGRPGV